MRRDGGGELSPAVRWSSPRSRDGRQHRAVQPRLAVQHAVEDDRSQPVGLDRVAGRQQLQPVGDDRGEGVLVLGAKRDQRVQRRRHALPVRRTRDARAEQPDAAALQQHDVPWARVGQRVPGPGRRDVRRHERPCHRRRIADLAWARRASALQPLAHQHARGRNSRSGAGTTRSGTPRSARRSRAASRPRAPGPARPARSRAPRAGSRPRPSRRTPRAAAPPGRRATQGHCEPRWPARAAGPSPRPRRRRARRGAPAHRASPRPARAPARRAPSRPAAPRALQRLLDVLERDRRRRLGARLLQLAGQPRSVGGTASSATSAAVRPSANRPLDERRTSAPPASTRVRSAGGRDGRGGGHEPRRLWGQCGDRLGDRRVAGHDVEGQPDRRRGGEDRGEHGGDVGARDLPAIQVPADADAARARLIGQAAGRTIVNAKPLSASFLSAWPLARR